MAGFGRKANPAMVHNFIFLYQFGSKKMTKVLVIDNSENVLQLLREPIEGDGHHVFTAQNGQAGLKAAWQHSPDLVILNLLMPTMDGYETE
jgi:CheY-like chemotaxis protein